MHSEHTYSDASPDDDDNDDPTAVDCYEIYDDEGKFTPTHLKKAVYVCDKFRISQEAYHELRMELKGHYPPIWLVKRMKNIMSARIPYFPGDTVKTLRIFVNLKCLNTLLSASDPAWSEGGGGQET